MPGFKPLQTLGMAVVSLLGLLLLLELGSIVSSLFQIELLTRMQVGDFTMEEADANDMRQGCIGLVWLGTFIVTAIIFIIWNHRAYKNVDSFGGVRSMGPGWAIGGWFVPFLNLVRPFQVMRECWAAAVATEEPVAMVNAPPWLSLWWGLWIVNNILGNVVFRFEEPQEISGYITNTWWYIASDVTSIAAGAAAIAVVLKVTRAQTKAGNRAPIQDIAEVFG